MRFPNLTKEHGLYVADVAKAQDIAEADAEKGPYGVNKKGKAVLINENPGDGWSVYDEYRGLYRRTDEKDNPTGHKRLDPKKKDVMFTSDPNIAKYGIGTLLEKSYGRASDLATPVHVFTRVDEALFQKAHNPFWEWWGCVSAAVGNV